MWDHHLGLISLYDYYLKGNMKVVETYWLFTHNSNSGTWTYLCSVNDLNAAKDRANKEAKDGLIVKMARAIADYEPPLNQVKITNYY